MFSTSRVEVADALSPASPDRSILTAVKGGGIVFAGRVFEYGSRFILGVLLARLLGADQLGLYNLALTAATVTAGLATLGLKSALVRYVSHSASRRDELGLGGTLQVGLGMPAALSLFMGLGLYVLAPDIAERLFREPRLVPLLRLASLLVPFLALSELIAAATQGFKKMQYAVVAQNISQPVIRLILVVVLAIVVGLNANNALVAFGLTLLIVTALLVYFLNGLFSLRRSLQTARREIREMLAFSLPIYLSDLITTFRNNVQTVLLGSLNTVATVGIFSVASQVSLIGRLFHQSIVTVSMPIVSELYSQGEQEQMGRFYKTMTKWTLTLNLPIFLVIQLFAVPILSIFGQDFVGGAMALAILAWGNLVNAGTGICGVFLDMSGNTSMKLVNSIVTVALTLALNVLLIPNYGIIGAAVAALAAGAIVNLLRLLEVFILLRLLPYDGSFLKVLAAGLVALGVAWGVRELFGTQSNVFYAGLNATLLLVVYAGVVLMLGLSQEDRAVLDRVRRRLRIFPVR